MEKYRHYGDASTGINPFTTPQLLTSGVPAILPAILFPLRLVIAAPLLLLLLLVDLLAYQVFFKALPAVLYAVLPIGGVQSALVRALLFVLGQVRVVYREAPAKKGFTKGMSCDAPDLPIRVGDVVICSMQSVWDTWALTAANWIAAYNSNYEHRRRSAGARSAPVAASAPPRRGTAVKNNNQVLYAFYRPCKTSSADASSRSAASAQLHFFLPSPWQRWRMWAYVWMSGTRAFFDDLRVPPVGSPSTVRGRPDGGSDADESLVNLIAAQQLAARLRVPLVVFLEGTCTNGNGVLQMPVLKLVEGEVEEGGKCFAGPALRAIVMDYENRAMHSVVTEKAAATCFLTNRALAFLDPSGLMRTLRRVCWDGQSFTSSVFVTIIPPSLLLKTKPPSTALGSGAITSPLPSSPSRTLTIGEMEAIRREMCNASALPPRKPLAVGLKEKKGFLDAACAAAAMNKAHAGSP